MKKVYSLLLIMSFSTSIIAQYPYHNTLDTAAEQGAAYGFAFNTTGMESVVESTLGVGSSPCMTIESSSAFVVGNDDSAFIIYEGSHTHTAGVSDGFSVSLASHDGEPVEVRFKIVYGGSIYSMTTADGMGAYPNISVDHTDFQTYVFDFTYFVGFAGIYPAVGVYAYSAVEDDPATVEDETAPATGQQTEFKLLVDDFKVDNIATMSTDNLTFIRSEINIFPNPVNDKVNFSTDQNINSAKIIDVTGRVLKEINNLSSGENSIDVQELSSGKYLLLLDLENDRRAIKFIK